MIRKIKISCITVILPFVLLVVYGKNKVTSYNYEDYIINAEYSTTSDKNEMINFAPYLEDIIVDDKVNSYADLLKYSLYCFDVIVTDVEFSGEGLINYCTITNVIKGKNSKTGDSIAIYDLIFLLAESGTVYSEGARPLKINDTYRVFIDKAPNPIIKGAYIFNSFKYGSIRLNNEGPNYLLNQNLNEIKLSLKEAMEYDYISRKDSFEIYDKIYREINSLD